MKYCRFHPDREAVYKSRLCRECFTGRQREYRKGRNIKRQTTNTEKVRDELNKEDLLKDARNGWDLKNLYRRYSSYSDTAIRKILKDNGIPIKEEKSYRKATQDTYSVVGINTDMLDWTCSIKPTHQKARMSQCG